MQAAPELLEPQKEPWEPWDPQMPEEPAPPKTTAAVPVLPLNEELLKYAHRVEKDLISAHAPPDEALLAKLASGEISTALDLQDLQAQLARRVVALIGVPPIAWTV